MMDELKEEGSVKEHMICMVKEGNMDIARTCVDGIVTHFDRLGTLFCCCRLTLWPPSYCSAQSGYAEHAHWCHHVDNNVEPIDLGVPELEQLNPNATCCSIPQCGNRNENWFCLKCQVIFCGRFAHGHMLQHFEATGHCVAAGLSDLSFWCYKCETYLYHRTIPKLYAAYTILTMLKFHEAPVDPPLPSAEPVERIMPMDSVEEEKGEPTATFSFGSAQSSQTQASSQYEDDGSQDNVMETSAIMRDVPTRSSSQLDPYSATPTRSSSSVLGLAPPITNMSQLLPTTGWTCEACDLQNKDSVTQCISCETPKPGCQPQVASSTAASSANVGGFTFGAVEPGKAEPVKSPVVGMTPEQVAHPLIQKILGIIYGNALGDAFGLSTEFLDRKIVNRLYGPTYDPNTGVGQIPFPNYKKSHHSSRWEDGDWTDDTDQMVLIMETLLESYTGAHRTSPDPKLLNPTIFSHKLKHWVKYGFKELGDNGGMGLGALTASVVSHPAFLSDPHAAAKEVWIRGGKKAAANGGVMRTSITGVFDYYDFPAVIANTKNMCEVTHADPRCIGSCLLTTLLISGILQGAPINTSAQIETLIQQCLTLTLQHITISEEHKSDFLEYVGMTELSEMKLDDPPAIGFTLKCLSSGLYGLRSPDGFIPTMTRLVREAGDADTNGAVCGALIGARVGYDQLPQTWLEAMPNKKWLDAKVVQLVKLMMERYEAHKEASAKAAVLAANAVVNSSSTSSASKH